MERKVAEKILIQKMPQTYKVISQYLKDNEKRYSYQTLIGHYRFLLNFFSLHQKEFFMVKDKDIERWCIKLKEKGCSKRSIRQYDWILKSFYKYACKNGFLDEDKISDKLKIKDITPPKKIDKSIFSRYNLKRTEKVIDNFLDDQKFKYAEICLKNDHYNFREFFKYCHKDFDEITNEDVENYHQALMQKGLPGQTIMVKTISLKKLYRYCREKDLLGEIPPLLQGKEFPDKDMWVKNGLGKTKEVIEQFKKDYQVRLSKRTLMIYGNFYFHFFDYCKLNFDQIQSKNIRTWLIALDTMGQSSKSISIKLDSLKVFFRYCKDEELIQTDPTTEISNPKIRVSKSKYRRYVDKATITRLMEHTKGKPLEQAIISTLYTTGVRVSELVNILIDDIDFHSTRILIRKGKRRVDRFVVFTKDCEQRLKIHLENQKGPYLFSLKEGEPIKTSWIQYKMKGYEKELKLEQPLSPHVFRHTLAINLILRGMPLSYVQELLGHEDIKITQRYSKLVTSELKAKYDFYT